MKKAGIILILSAFAWCCGQPKGPDVSDIRADLELQRFYNDFFALDTVHLYAGLETLQAKYPGFLPDFMFNILGLPPYSDTSTQVMAAVKQFLRDYRPVKDSVDRQFTSLDPVKTKVQGGLQHVKYYFPQYKLPTRLICFVGPMDAFYKASLDGYGDVLTSEGLGVGLQLHLGSDFSMYHSEMGQSLYPDYISRRFTPDYIPVNCMKNIIDDLYPEDLRGLSLVDQMVEKGKRLFVLDKLLPETPDSLKTGYTGAQLKGCYANEGRIWNFFLANNLLLATEPDLLKGYIDDGPNTPEFGEGSPGFIGLFCGWQIVKKYMDENPSVTLPELLRTPPRKVYEVSKYRPK